MPLIYLASPYSHKEEQIRINRYEEALKATAWLLRQGYNVFSPIVHSHPLVKHDLPTSFDFWRNCDLDILNRCDAIITLAIDGWHHSQGVGAEMQWANENGKPMAMLHCEPYNIVSLGQSQFPVPDKLVYCN